MQEVQILGDFPTSLIISLGAVHCSLTDLFFMCFDHRKQKIKVMLKKYASISYKIWSKVILSSMLLSIAEVDLF